MKNRSNQIFEYIENNDAQAINSLIAKLDDKQIKKILMQQNQDGDTPLMLASQQGYADVIKSL